MATYTVKILNVDGGVRHTRQIHAVRNYDAAEIAEELAQSAKDSGGYEVWLRNRNIFRHTQFASQKNKA